MKILPNQQNITHWGPSVVRKSLKNGGPCATRTHDQLVKRQSAELTLTRCLSDVFQSLAGQYFSLISPDNPLISRSRIDFITHF